MFERQNSTIVSVSVRNDMLAEIDKRRQTYSRLAWISNTLYNVLNEK